MHVLILSSNNGGGHNAAAEALRERLERSGHTCRIADCLSFLSPGLSRAISRLHTFVYRHVPRIFSAGYRYTERHRGMFVHGHLTRAVIGLGKAALGRMILREGYDAVLCTHVFGAMMLSDAVKRYNLQIKTALFETDYTVSPGASAVQVDLHFVPSEQIKNDLIRLGIPEEKIIVSGIPVRQAFREAAQKPIAKQRLGISPEQRHLLMMAGSMGCGPMEKVLRILAESAGAETHISIVCGSNQKLQRKLAAVYRENDRVSVYGRTEQVSALMDSADLYLTKPGGISVSEAAAKRLPMVLVDTVGGCECHNAAFFLQSGGAVCAGSAEEAVNLCIRLLDAPEKREQMAGALAGLQCAEDVCSAIERASVSTSAAVQAPQKCARNFTLSLAEKRHGTLLLFWPAYFLSFFLLERLTQGVVYHPVHCALDDVIPFCEWALIPYLAWHVLIAVMVLYTFRRDIPAFRKLMWYFIATYCVTLVIYVIYPTCQQLRPEAFPRDNVLTRAVALVYWFDTSTNVCPSMHIIGALGLWFTAKECSCFSKPAWRISWGVTVALICISTLLMKQHSVIDVVAALPVSLFGWLLCYRPRRVRVVRNKLIQMT